MSVFLIFLRFRIFLFLIFCFFINTCSDFEGFKSHKIKVCSSLGEKERTFHYHPFYKSSPIYMYCILRSKIRWQEKGTELSFHLTLLSRNKGTYVFKNKIMYENDCYNIANTSVSFRTNNRPEKSKTVALVSFVLHNSFRDKSCEMTRCEIYGGRSKHFLRKQGIKYM